MDQSESSIWQGGGAFHEIDQRAAFGKEEGLYMKLTNRRAAFGDKEGLAMKGTI